MTISHKILSQGLFATLAVATMSVGFVGCSSGSSAPAPAPIAVAPLAECSRDVADSYNQIVGELKDLKDERAEGDMSDKGRSRNDGYADMDRDAKKVVQNIDELEQRFQNANCQITRHGQAVAIQSNLDSVENALDALHENIATLNGQERMADGSDPMAPLDSVSFEAI
jgi:hypothetical protein